MDAAAAIETHARSLGFGHFRVAPVQVPAPHAQAFVDWIEAGHHAGMDYLSRGAPERIDPTLRLASARSALVLAAEHGHDRPPDPGGLTGKVARYAWGRDYHNVLGKRLKKFTKWLRGEGIAAWGGIDTAPILERAWANAAGLGYSGKNGLQILPAKGSYLLLAVVFVDLELAPTPALKRDHCGSCTRCLVACPTQAFVGPHILDARRCLSFHNIESRSSIPLYLRAPMGRWVFGCDVCQEVCPHNVRPTDPLHEAFAPKNAWLDLEWVLGASAEQINTDLAGTPLRRPGPVGLKRNAAVVLGNLKDPAAIPVLRPLTSNPDAMLAEHARWALEQLGG